MPLPPFQRTLDHHRDDLYRFLVAVAGRDDADDCFQETVIAALRAYPRLDDDANVRAWLLTIAHRKAIDAHRARRRRAVPIAEVPDPPGGESADPDGGPDRALWALVQRLPAKQRGAVALRFVADLDHATIGTALGCSPDAARRNLHEGLTTLRKEWTR